MTPERAAEVLRNSIDVRMLMPRKHEMDNAALMGAEALEFQVWLFEDMGAFCGFRVQWLLKMWHGEDSFLDYARAEWEKGKVEK